MKTFKNILTPKKSTKKHSKKKKSNFIQISLLKNKQQKESWEFNNHQREEQYSDLKRVCNLSKQMNKDPFSVREKGEEEEKEEINKEEKNENIIKSMMNGFMLERSFQSNTLFSFNMKDNPTHLESIAKIFMNLFPHEHDAYFCFSSFMELMDRNIYTQQRTFSFLKQEESDEGCYHQISYCLQLLENRESKILVHIKSFNFHLDSFLYSWFKSRFTSCRISPSDLLKIWDKVICVSVDYISCFGASILTYFYSQILEKKDSKQLANFLLQLPHIDIEKLLKLTSEFYETLINF